MRCMSFRKTGDATPLGEVKVPKESKPTFTVLGTDGQPERVLQGAEAEAFEQLVRDLDQRK